jgi:hypothetical protein
MTTKRATGNAITPNISPPPSSWYTQSSTQIRATQFSSDESRNWCDIGFCFLLFAELLWASNFACHSQLPTTRGARLCRVATDAHQRFPFDDTLSFVEIQQPRRNFPDFAQRNNQGTLVVESEMLMPSVESRIKEPYDGT